MKLEAGTKVKSLITLDIGCDKTDNLVIYPNTIGYTTGNTCMMDRFHEEEECNEIKFDEFGSYYLFNHEYEVIEP